MAELECTHEEADTRMLFHAVRTSPSGFQTIVIRSPDTDVAVLAFGCGPLILCWQFVKGSPMHIRTGKKHHVHYIHVFAVRQKLGEQVSNALLGLHSLTVCDSTSAFKKCDKSLLLILSC